MGSKSEKIGFFQFFSIFINGISAKLNELESESDTLAQNSLENQFPFHYNFRIVQCFAMKMTMVMIIGNKLLMMLMVMMLKLEVKAHKL